MIRADFLIPALLCCSVLVGCSGGDGGPERLATVPAGGLVTLDGGDIGEVTLDFVPTVSQGDRVRSASARVTAGGVFTVTTYDEGDGIVAGSYNVKVNHPIDAMSPPNVAPFELTVGDSGNSDLLIDLKTQKGTKGTLMSPTLDAGGASTDL